LEDGTPVIAEYNEPDINQLSFGAPKNAPADSNVFAHELGHVFGEFKQDSSQTIERSLGHSNVSKCEEMLVYSDDFALPITMDRARAKTCTTVPYANQSDIMSNTSGNVEANVFNSVDRQRLGLMDKDSIKVLNTSGHYTIDLQALNDTSGNGTKMIRIPIPKGHIIPVNTLKNNDPAAEPAAVADGSWSYVIQFSPKIDELDNAMPDVNNVMLMLVQYQGELPKSGVDTYLVPLAPVNSKSYGLAADYRGKYYEDVDSNWAMRLGQTNVSNGVSGHATLDVTVIKAPAK
jgi:hypothetical protein